MRKAYFVLIAVVQLSVTTFAQSKASFEKECRISAGFGAAGPVERNPRVGMGGWAQLDYRLLENVSVAMDFTNAAFKYGTFADIRDNDTFTSDFYINNFSLLLRYHLLPKSNLKLSIASGWTYSVWQIQYTFYERTSTATTTSRTLKRELSAYSKYRIPVLVEAAYPLTKKISITTRLMYNESLDTDDTYFAGLGLSLKL